MLAAYRRDDWSTRDLAALGYHLSTCAACRQSEARYRRVGESVRQLPTITPPPEFRESVFAAIRALQLDQRAATPAISEVTGADTSPSLPVVRLAPVVRLDTHRAARRRGFDPRMISAIAAVLIVGIFATQIVPALAGKSLGGIASSLTNAGSRPASSPLPVAHYQPDARYAHVTSVFANGRWLVYSSTAADGSAMLVAQQRQGGTAAPLLHAPVNGALAIRAVTDQWAIWTTEGAAGSGTWSMAASRLDATGSAPLVLARSDTAGPDAPALLTGVAATEAGVLITAQTAAGTGVLVRYDLSGATPTSQVIARTHASGHLMTNPAAVADGYYWSEVWTNKQHFLYGSVWHRDAAGHEVRLLADDHVFTPLVAHGALLWVAAPNATATGTDALALRQALATVTGTLAARTLDGSRQWEVAPTIQAATLRAAGPLVLWHDQAQTHTYDLRHDAPSALDAQVRLATYMGDSAAAVAWSAGADSPINVYDVR